MPASADAGSSIKTGISEAEEDLRTKSIAAPIKTEMLKGTRRPSSNGKNFEPKIQMACGFKEQCRLVQNFRNQETATVKALIPLLNNAVPIVAVIFIL
eukprot:3102038-Prymnesium_polylepis.1